MFFFYFGNKMELGKVVEKVLLKKYVFVSRFTYYFWYLFIFYFWLNNAQLISIYIPHLSAFTNTPYLPILSLIATRQSSDLLPPKVQQEKIHNYLCEEKSQLLRPTAFESQHLTSIFHSICLLIYAHSFNEYFQIFGSGATRHPKGATFSMPLIKEISEES